VPAAVASGLASRPPYIAPVQGLALSTTGAPAPADAQLLLLLNSDRAAANVPLLAWDACLAQVASRNARRVAAQGYASPGDGQAQGLACDRGSRDSAELMGYWSSADAVQVNALFLADPAQRQHLLGRFDHVGAAWAVSSSGMAFLVVELC
jgi:uncharacterized protein YkwD